MKKFNDVAQYQREILQVVPGYESLHRVVPPLLQAYLGGRAANILVVGCGPGQELIALAKLEPQWTLHGLDASAEMIEWARESVRAQGLDGRISLSHAKLEESITDEYYDGVLCLLVSHFLPDDGEKAAFFRGIASRLKPEGIWMGADLFHDPHLSIPLSRAYLHWAKARGVVGERLKVMESRLGQLFHPLSQVRLRGLLEESGLAYEGRYFQALGIAGDLARKPAAEL